MNKRTLIVVVVTVWALVVVGAGGVAIALLARDSDNGNAGGKPTESAQPTVSGPDDRSLDEWLTDWTIEHERVAYIASEVVTVLALLASVALLLGGAQALVWWWTA